ncbi:hypothetical protein EB21_02659 [Enterococcus faecium]|uniref:hypothetical protein n=1 Tax=Enterococcus faecium TaxID=1352 RepID=UPI000DE9C85E|nr:hypothetical protein [Enterococcus faecium]RBS44445.1 hypothetical protein EB21_02659 [Enterococcus faecium]HBK5215529.1 hypothetical protein [Enterococcus faecium]
MKILDQINNLAFDIMHERSHEKNFERAQKIYELTLLEKIELNDNQKIVLDWLKSESVLSKESPILAINAFSDKHLLGKLPDEVHTAFKKLDYKQEYEVLALFIQEEGNSKYEL